MMSTFNHVVLMCPEVKTGGPECIHQLALQINRNGGHAVLAYTGPYSILDFGAEFLRGDAMHSPMLDHFNKYQPQALREVPLAPETLVVYPEISVHEAMTAPAGNYRRAIWWLSVDNAVFRNPRLTNFAYRKKLFADKNMIHFYQSEYAHAFLRSAGAPNIYAMTDYTDPEFVRASQSAANLPIMQRENTICFFPQKGAVLAKQFIESDALRHRVNLLPIFGMSKTQVRATLFTARIYIDFGHHPGKDRVPREAVIAGAVVLAHAAGAANYWGDYPLSPEHKFTAGDVYSGRIYQRIDAILDNPQQHFDAQANYRQAIMNEPEKFDREVRMFFGGGNTYNKAS